MTSKTLAISLFAMLIFGGLRAEASLDYFIKFDGLNGESQDVTYTNQCDVLSWSWGMTNSGTMHDGSGGGAGKVSVRDLSLIKYVDKASPVLMLYACDGRHFATVTLTVRLNGGTQPVILKITMTEVIVTSVSTGGAGGEIRMTENILLNFAEVRVEYQPLKQDGTPDGGPIPFGWDIAKNVKL